MPVNEHPPPPPSRAPRVFVDEEGPAKRQRLIRSDALEEANYLVASELAAGRLRNATPEQLDRAVLDRAALFEQYLTSGYDLAARLPREHPQ